jgi:acetate---CoA ligase (ADP-forming)
VSPTSRDLAPLFEPRSVAVVGASSDPAKWGQWLARGALAGAHRRRVYLVNRSGGEVLGHPTYRTLAELPESPELVVLAVPAASFEEATDAALSAGARAIVAIAAGLGETGDDGRSRERAVVARVREAGAILLGPNCLGVYDGSSELDLSSSDFTPGTISLVSQSGNLAIEISLLAREVGLGIARFASLGNQADLEAAELIRATTAHEQTELIGVYCEDFRDGREFARAAHKAREAGKPVVLIAGGSTAPGARAAESHTGALVSDSRAIDAACRAAGIVRVSTPREFVGVAQVLLGASRPRGRRVAVVTDGGGSAVVGADLATGAGLELPHLSRALAESLAAIMPPTATTTNPVDFAGAGEQDLRSYERVPRLLLESGEIDAVLLTGYLGGYSATSDELREPETHAARGLAQAMADADRTVVVQTMYWQEAPALALRERGVPVFRDVDAAVHSLAAVAEHSLNPPWGVPDLPPPSRLATRDDDAARTLLADAGVEFPHARRVATPEQALAAAADLGYPLVLKAAGVVHKSDVGGVVVGIEDEAALLAAWSDMTDRLDPPSVVVERLVDADASVELIVGCKRDPRFGPVLLVGFGGIFTEVLDDVAVALAPARPEQIRTLLLELRGAELLTGARGRPRLAIDAAAEGAAAVSRVGAAHPELESIEINPLLVTDTSAVGLDARLVYDQPR